MGKDSPSPPATPDYVGAANATAAGNKEAAIAASEANRVNQYTPNGNLIYQQTGTSANGNPLWSATTTYSPAQQAIFDQQTKLNAGLMGTANTGLNYANDVLSHPGVDTSKLAQVGINPGQSYQDAMMSRLQPQIDRENQQSDAQLANQGIMQGSEAYNNAKRLLGQQHNDLLNNATVQGFNTGLSANQQGFQQQAYNQMQPINVINALRTGSQVQSPTFQNVPQQQTTTGPNLLGAAQAQYQGDLNSYNAQMGAQNNMTQGLFGVAGQVAGALPWGTMLSDRRLKSDIVKIGEHKAGIGIYSYTIGGRKQIGVMADEVERVLPSAVIVGADGFKRVDYSQLQ